MGEFDSFYAVWWNAPSLWSGAWWIMSMTYVLHKDKDKLKLFYLNKNNWNLFYRNKNKFLVLIW